jgi:RNA polymerase sigma-70 factor (ECF subfamily)
MNETGILTDMYVRALSTSSRNSQKQVLAEIYDCYRLDVFRYAYRALRDHELAEECVAETFYRFLVAVQAGTPFENIRAYLYRVAHNWITDYYRRQLPATISLKDYVQFDYECNPSLICVKNMDSQRIRSAIRCLPPQQRQVIELRYLEEWSHIEVAKALGKTVEATRALQYRAMETLRQILIDCS